MMMMMMMMTTIMTRMMMMMIMRVMMKMMTMMTMMKMMKMMMKMTMMTTMMMVMMKKVKDLIPSVVFVGESKAWISLSDAERHSAEWLGYNSIRWAVSPRRTIAIVDVALISFWCRMMKEIRLCRDLISAPNTAMRTPQTS